MAGGTIVVEGPSGFRHVAEQPGRTVALAILLLEPAAPPDECVEARHVDIGQRTAGPRCKTEAQYGADIALPGVGQDSLLEAPRRFQRLNEQQPLLQDFGVELRRRARRCNLGEPVPKPLAAALRIIIKAAP